MVNVLDSFRRIGRQKIMVIGDLMLDTYTIGKARRISPEAPVPVLHVQREEHRPGGAGNVALNLVSMGAEVVMAGRVGADEWGEKLVRSLKEEGIHTEGIWTEAGSRTPVKNRLIADRQQMARVDYETVTPLREAVEQQMIEALPNLLNSVKVAAVSDYGKGMMTRTLLAALIEACREREIPVIVDPKGVDFSKYKKAAIVKPNLGEVYGAAHLPLDAPLEAAARKVLEEAQAEVLMVTRSEEGISLFYQTGERKDFCAQKREVMDVTGAGDTVLSMMALALASGLSVDDAAILSNVAGGIAVSHFGCARVTRSEIARQLLGQALGGDRGNKVFDQAHILTLQEALRDREFAVLSLSSKEGIGASVLEAIRRASKKRKGELVVHIEDSDPDPVFVDVVAAQADVDYVIVMSGGLEQVCPLMKPGEVYTLDTLGALA